MRLRRVLLLVAIAAVAVGFVLHRVPEEPIPAPPATQATPSAHTVASAHAGEHGFFDMAMTEPAAQPTRQPGGANWRVIEAKLASAESLRAFVYDMLRQPKEGGFLYVFGIINQCEANLKTDTAGLPVPQHQAIENMRARCDFSKQEIDEARRQLHAIRNLDLAADPVAGPIFSFMQAKDDAGRMAVLDAAISVGNPKVLGPLVSGAIQSTLPADFAPQGRSASDYERYATMLVECQLGAACSGDRALMVMDLCTNHGWCADNVRDALRMGLGDKFAPLDQLATRVTNDIRKRNYPFLLHGA